jgi:hypothetical protein
MKEDRNRYNYFVIRKYVIELLENKLKFSNLNHEQFLKETV